MPTSDVIVIGLGVMGLSSCAALAGRGVRVLGIDQFDFGHAMGSSHGATRVFRTAYFEHPDYVPLLKRSLELWRELERQSGATLFIDTGALYMGPAGSALVRGSIESARAHDIAVESLGFEEIRRRFPQLVLPEDTIGVLERETAGMLLAERSLLSFARLALARGASLQTREKVLSWTSGGNLVRVITDRAMYEAQKLIFCGGAWSARLRADMSLPLRATRQLSAWFWPRSHESFGHKDFPVWAIESSGGTFHYGFPLHGDDIGMKAACHDPGEAFDPETAHRRSELSEAQRLHDFMREHIPEAAGQLLKTQVCLYALTPDSHFIMDAHPRVENVFFACGFSGHGFKFAPIIGEIMADLAVEGATSHPIEFLSMKRFSE